MKTEKTLLTKIRNETRDNTADCKEVKDIITEYY